MVETGYKYDASITNPSDPIPTHKLGVSPTCMDATVGDVTPLVSQVGGDHYKKLGDYQPWSVMAKWMTPEELRGYMKGTVCAYICREADKGGRTDIEKAMHTIQIYLEVSK
jgi:hypothetical protein